VTGTATAEYLRRVDDIAEVVRADAATSDRDRRLGDATLAALRESQLTRMLVPERLGGGGLTLAEAYPVIEAMAGVDGSTGWNLNIGSGAATFAAALTDEGARDEVLGDPATLLCATLNVLAIKARRVDGGYVFDGRATYLSGSSYAQWLAIGGWVHVDGAPQVEGGQPVTVRGVVPIEQIPLEDTWQVAGLRATASHDATIDALFVPDRFMCGAERSGTGPSRDGASLLPPPTRFGGSLASVGLGCARGAIAALREVAGGRTSLGTFSPMRDRVDVQIDVGRAQGLVEAGSALVQRTWDSAMERVAAGEPVGVDLQAELRLAFVTAAELAADAADLVRRAAGSSGLYERDRVERFWRDAHAVPVHVLVSPRGYERVGRVLLGLDPLPGLL
jgi:alkylation response protein AidB-like acyl-CoA dehydrogenase